MKSKRNSDPPGVAPHLEESVRQQVLLKLRDKGWREEQIQWKPEWAIPDTPHDLTKRELGQKFAVCGTCDIAVFDDDSHEWPSLRAIFELKKPTIEAGRAQLMRYLSNEPMVKLGFWTNGKRSLAIYKSLDGNWIEVENASLPGPGDDLTKPATKSLTWDTMEEPTLPQLAGAFRRILNIVVANDTRATRSDVQLREVIHVLLVKLNSDFEARASGESVQFLIQGDEHSRVLKTALQVRQLFKDLFALRKDTIFSRDDRNELQLDDATIYQIVVELARYRMLFIRSEVAALAFQIFRAHALKAGEGQFLTPLRVIRPCVMALEIQYGDKVIDPACGTGGFLMEALRQVGEHLHTKHPHDIPLVGQLVTKWANERVYGVDIDDIGVKLTRMLMLAVGDGSTHTLIGDSISAHKWAHAYPQLLGPLSDDQYTVVITNPPFGEDLKIKASDAKAAGYSIANAAATGGPEKFVDLEIGLVFLERAWKLLRIGGRVGIVLPETYFFSHSYRWLPAWLRDRLTLRGMINIPMEAFQEFCRAKTNFYIFEKTGSGPSGKTASKGKMTATGET